MWKRRVAINFVLYVNLIHKKIMDGAERLFPIALYYSEYSLQHRFLGPRHDSLSLGRSPSIPIFYRLHGVVDIGGFGGCMSLYNNMKITDYFLCIKFHLICEGCLVWLLCITTCIGTIWSWGRSLNLSTLL